jgi:hypothetical protein
MTQHLANLLGQFKTSKHMTPPAIKEPPHKKQKPGIADPSIAGGSNSGLHREGRILFADGAGLANIATDPTVIFNPRVSAS